MSVYTSSTTCIISATAEGVGPMYVLVTEHEWQEQQREPGDVEQSRFERRHGEKEDILTTTGWVKEPAGE